MKIIRYERWNDIDIEFLDEFHFIKEHITYTNFKRGEVKNPYDKILYGVGYIDVGKWKSRYGKKISEVYLSWMHMLERCYDPEQKNKYPAYYNLCTVSKIWHSFQNFADWYDQNKYDIGYEVLHLDKDIKYPKNTVYSPYSCILVPQRINELFTCKTKENGLPVGISVSQSGKYVASYNGKHLGTYSELEDAYKMYAKSKEAAIRKVANEYKGIIPDSTYEVLMNYKVLIENDKNYLAN